MLAHLKTQETRADPNGRRTWKFRLIRTLYDRGLDGELVRLLFKFIDWLMELPEQLEKELRVDLAAFEEERMMPYVSSIERIAREEGKAEGKIEGRAEGKIEGRAEGKIEGRAEAKVETLLRLLIKRFKAAIPAELEVCVRSTADLTTLDAWIDTGLEASDLADFRRICGI